MISALSHAITIDLGALLVLLALALLLGVAIGKGPGPGPDRPRRIVGGYQPRIEPGAPRAGPPDQGSGGRGPIFRSGGLTPVIDHRPPPPPPPRKRPPIEVRIDGSLAMRSPPADLPDDLDGLIARVEAYPIAPVHRARIAAELRAARDNLRELGRSGPPIDHRPPPPPPPVER